MNRVFTHLKGQGEQDDPIEGFDEFMDMEQQIYLLQVKTRSVVLDNALYRRAHENGSHDDVIRALRVIAETHSNQALAEKAKELADAYQP